jgi:hypothetical protein
MDSYAVISNVTGAVLRWGYSRFSAGPDETEVRINEGALPAANVAFSDQTVENGALREMTATEKTAAESAGGEKDKLKLNGAIELTAFEVGELPETPPAPNLLILVIDAERPRLAVTTNTGYVYFDKV